MKQRNAIFFLTALLCGVMSSANAATGDIINEDFSGFTGINYATTSHNGWTLNRCTHFGGAYTEMLFFGDEENGRSSATSPTFSNLTEIKNAVMTFKYSNTNSNHASFSVTINGDGTFPDGTKVWPKETTSSAYTFKPVTRKLIGVSSTTSITFKLTSSTGGKFVIDDVVVSTADKPFLVKLAQEAASLTFPLASLKGDIAEGTRTVTYNGASMTGRRSSA